MISYQDFDYNGHGITFSSGPKYFMLNATKMSKPFGKRPVDWLNLSSTKEFLAAISNVRKSNICELVITKQGSSINGGQWTDVQHQKDGCYISRDGERRVA